MLICSAQNQRFWTHRFSERHSTRRNQSGSGKQGTTTQICIRGSILSGLTNYCSRYIADYSSITHPLRQLTRAETPFEWKEEHEQAFQQLKQALTSSPVLAHYSLTAPTRVVVDASLWAVGAVLLQQQDDSTYRPIAYGSRALSEMERKYTQIEKESLAIVFGCEHFHMHLYGRPFELETDHRPLEHIYRAKASNPGKPPPARIERWKLGLQEYDFKVVYRPGGRSIQNGQNPLGVHRCHQLSGRLCKNEQYPSRWLKNSNFQSVFCQ